MTQCGAELNGFQVVSGSMCFRKVSAPAALFSPSQAPVHQPGALSVANADKVASRTHDRL